VTASSLETATLGGGCFWCLEPVFMRLRGVQGVVSGYAGGAIANPSYDAVCTGRTGHAEVVQVTFDPAEISYRELLELFFAFHDPTTLNRQGPDTGTQYRSIIVAHTEDQARIARALIAELDLDHTFASRIVTEVVPFMTFWPAENHHQRYFDRNPERTYCSAVIAPKMAKLRRSWSERLKPES
jgi:peptide-methionine (S)-S-oxide reductase